MGLMFCPVALSEYHHPCRVSWYTAQTAGSPSAPHRCTAWRSTAAACG